MWPAFFPLYGPHHKTRPWQVNAPIIPLAPRCGCRTGRTANSLSSVIQEHSPVARRLPGLRLGPVRSPGQGFIPLSGNLPAGAMFTAVRWGPVRSPGQRFIPLSGNLPAGAVFTGVRWVSVRSPGQGVIPLSGNLPAGAMFTAVRWVSVRSPGKRGRFVARIRRCSIL